MSPKSSSIGWKPCIMKYNIWRLMKYSIDLIDDLTLNDLALISGVHMNASVLINTHMTYDKSFILTEKWFDGLFKIWAKPNYNYILEIRNLMTKFKLKISLRTKYDFFLILSRYCTRCNIFYYNSLFNLFDNNFTITLCILISYLNSTK
jgi:hypothetical protein